MATKRRTFKDFYKGATPVARFIYPHLIAPDTRFDPHGSFNVSIDMAGSAAEDFKKLIDQQFDIEYAHECEVHGKQLPKYHGRPYGPATEGKEKVEIPGVTRFRFARKAGGVYGPKHPRAGETWTASIPIFGASGTDRVTEEPWGGTMGRVSYVIVPWFTPSLGFGVRLQIEAIKIIELVSQGNVSPEAYGFEDEDGYVPAKENHDAPSTGVASEGTPDEGVDF